MKVLEKRFGMLNTWSARSHGGDMEADLQERREGALCRS